MDSLATSVFQTDRGRGRGSSLLISVLDPAGASCSFTQASYVLDVPGEGWLGLQLTPEQGAHVGWLQARGWTPRVVMRSDLDLEIETDLTVCPTPWEP